MALDIRSQKNVGMTADKFVLSSLFGTTSYQGRVIIASGKTTSASVQIVNPIDDYEAEEREWDMLFAQPHVQAGLERLAEEARRQFLAGETVEGGFAVE